MSAGQNEMVLTVVDTPTERTTFDVLDPEMQGRYLESIRQRRLVLAKVYEDLVAAKEEVKQSKLRAKADKLAARIYKKLVAADDALTAVENLQRDIKAIQMELLP